MIVGIVPGAHLNETDKIYDDRYVFNDIVSKRLFENGMKPIGILLNNGVLDKSILDICDAFVLPGGQMINKFHYEVIKYAIEKNKPLLGICLGAEAISIYSNIGNDKMDNYLDEEYTDSLLRRLPDGNIHNNQISAVRDLSKNKTHLIKIYNNTILHDIYNKDEIKVPCYHNFNLAEPKNNFIINSTAFDKVYEGIEYNDKSRFILGVHFHVELMPDNVLFTYFKNEIAKRKSES